MGLSKWKPGVENLEHPTDLEKNRQHKVTFGDRKDDISIRNVAPCFFRRKKFFATWLRFKMLRCFGEIGIFGEMQLGDLQFKCHQRLRIHLDDLN